MRIRLALVLAAVVLPAVLALPVPGPAFDAAWAQSTRLPDAPDKLPRVSRGDRTKNLDFLFEALKVAPDADAAKLVESRIWALWLASMPSVWAVGIGFGLRLGLNRCLRGIAL